MTDLLRVYLDPDEICQTGDRAGYPFAWFQLTTVSVEGDAFAAGGSVTRQLLPIKDLVRERAEHRCERCRHPFVVGESSMMVPHPHGEVRANGEPVMVNASWCDEHCTHGGPIFTFSEFGTMTDPAYVEGAFDVREHLEGGFNAAAIWRILTVHHLNGIKYDCRWWNLAALCQRCHLTIQGKVYMDRPWSKPHSDWFKPHAAGFYAWKYLDLELTREETLERLDELLELELTQDALF